MTANDEDGPQSPAKDAPGIPEREDLAALYALLAPKIAREVEMQVSRALETMSAAPAFTTDSSAPSEAAMQGYAQLLPQMAAMARAFTSLPASSSSGEQAPAGAPLFDAAIPRFDAAALRPEELSRAFQTMLQAGRWDPAAMVPGTPTDSRNSNPFVVTPGQVPGGDILQNTYAKAWELATQSYTRMAETYREGFERHSRAAADAVTGNAPLQERQGVAMDAARSAVRELGEALAREGQRLTRDLQALAANLGDEQRAPIDETAEHSGERARRYSRTKR